MIKANVTTTTKTCRKIHLNSHSSTKIGNNSSIENPCLACFDLRTSSDWHYVCSQHYQPYLIWALSVDISCILLMMILMRPHIKDQN